VRSLSLFPLTGTVELFWVRSLSLFPLTGTVEIGCHETTGDQLARK
jgi:hypothetical protein